METIRELEQRLAEAKAKEKLDAENKELETLRQTYQGLAFGTNSFFQQSKTAHYNAIMIESIERIEENGRGIAKGTITCTYRSINFVNGPDWKSKHKASNYSRGLYEHHLSDSAFSMSYKIGNLIDRKKEIPVELFEQLYGAGEEIDAMLVNVFKGKIALTVSKTCGDGTTQDVILKNHTRMGIDLIDLEKYPKLLHALRYARLPGMLEDRFLVRDWARKSLELQISILQEEMSSEFCIERIYSAKRHEISIIKDHFAILKV